MGPGALCIFRSHLGNDPTPELAEEEFVNAMVTLLLDSILGRMKI